MRNSGIKLWMAIEYSPWLHQVGPPSYVAFARHLPNFYLHFSTWYRSWAEERHGRVKKLQEEEYDKCWTSVVQRASLFTCWRLPLTQCWQWQLSHISTWFQLGSYRLQTGSKLKFFGNLDKTMWAHPSSLPHMPATSGAHPSKTSQRNGTNNDVKGSI